MSDIRFWKGGNITSMTGDNIFVFGSNPQGRHGKGAAQSALKFGAEYYNGRGLQGNSYALVTKNLKANYFEESTGITYKRYGEGSVSLEMISKNIDELYQCALNNPEKTFFVAYTNDSKNLNGYSSKQIWDVFTENKMVPLNMRFHDSFKPLVNYQNKITEELKIKKSESEDSIMNYSEEIKADDIPREKFTFFWHSPSPFSQWHPSKFKVKDITFTSCEQFMMYCKAKLFKDELVAKEILDINMSEHIFYDESGSETHREDTVVKKYFNGEMDKEDILNNYNLKKEWDGFQKKIKDLGRKVAGYNEETWIKNRVSYVSKGNFEKFNQNEDLKKEIIKTEGTILAESNPYDKIWAIGIKESDKDATNPSKWKGLNLLGEILTRLREKLKNDLILTKKKNEVLNKQQKSRSGFSR